LEDIGVPSDQDYDLGRTPSRGTSPAWTISWNRRHPLKRRLAPPTRRPRRARGKSAPAPPS
jgi:hypothetical protein